MPHSDIHGSKPARGSPWLFAACHVLHRLLMPRHPPNALILLEITIVSALAENSLPTMHRNHPRLRLAPKPHIIPAHRRPLTQQMSSTPLNTMPQSSDATGLPTAEPVRRMPTATRPETHQNLINPDKDHSAPNRGRRTTSALRQRRTDYFSVTTKAKGVAHLTPPKASSLWKPV